MKTTEKILTLLAQNTTYLSGQDLAEKLGLSRTAVWKAIQTLQAAGYSIDSQAHRGYRLLDSGRLSETFIRRNLTTTQPLQFELHDSLSSTNTRAKELGALPQTVDPQVIISDQQTGGYGRYGRTFASPQGTGIYLSLLLQNHQKSFDAGLLTTATATALCRALVSQLKIEPTIKWVNDVLWQGKKISGILTEGITDFETGNLKQIVVGVGIDYLTDPATFSSELQERAGSLRSAALSQDVSRNSLIAAFLNEFFKLYPTFNSADFIADYRHYCSTIGQEVTLTQGSHTTTGRVVSITDHGELVLADGRIFSSGEITKLRS